MLKNIMKNKCHLNKIIKIYIIHCHKTITINILYNCLFITNIDINTNLYKEKKIILSSNELKRNICKKDIFRNIIDNKMTKKYFLV